MTGLSARRSPACMAFDVYDHQAEAAGIEQLIYHQTPGEMSMPRPYKPYIAQTIGELNDELGWMMLNAPTFIDRTGYFPERSVETAFKGFNQGLDTLRGKLGEERYIKMREMSDQMRLLFESDPESKTGASKAGRMIIHEMQLMLRRKRPTSKDVASA